MELDVAFQSFQFHLPAVIKTNFFFFKKKQSFLSLLQPLFTVPIEWDFQLDAKAKL